MQKVLIFIYALFFFCCYAQLVRGVYVLSANFVSSLAVPIIFGLFPYANVG